MLLKVFARESQFYKCILKMQHSKTTLGLNEVSNISLCAYWISLLETLF